MTDCLNELARLYKARVPAVLVTVAGVRGSAPRELGAKMLVTAQDTFGTIGGGALEYQGIRLAAERLQSEEPAGFLRRFPLGSNCGQCCGGVVDLLFEPLKGIACIDELIAAWHGRSDAVLITALNAAGEPVKFLLDQEGKPQGNNLHENLLPAAATRQAVALLSEGAIARRCDTPGRLGDFLLMEPVRDNGFDIAVFGAGHVGSALVQTLAGLDCRVRWIDSRRDVFPLKIATNVQRVESVDPAREVEALSPATFCFIMTHSHALDLEITAAILRRGDFAYCGLIGSLTKRNRFEARLRKLGFNKQQLQQLTCPIGISGISGKKPQEIAIAAAAEVLRRRERQLALQKGADAQLYTLNA